MQCIASQRNYDLSFVPRKNENFNVLIIVGSNRQKLPNSQNRQFFEVVLEIVFELMIVIFDILIGES